jgi:3-keto steroid reductase
MLNSQNHTIGVYKGAIAAVHLSLISLSFIPAFLAPLSKSPPTGTANGNSYTKKTYPVRFGSQSNMWGTERVGITPVVDWYQHQEESEVLLQKCDDLYEQFWETEGMLPSKS